MVITIALADLIIHEDVGMIDKSNDLVMVTSQNRAKWITGSGSWEVAPAATFRTDWLPG